jgi:hypothetical protein
MYDKRKILGFSSVSIFLISVYLYTIAPTVSLWDCGEFIACSHILGVPHPPGTPFFILLGRIFDLIIPFKEVAQRINLLSSLSSALAGGFLYLIVLSVIARFRENRGKRLLSSYHLIAVLSAIGAGLSYSVWDTSVEAEVYSISILILAIGLWLTIHWNENRKMRGDNNYLLLLAYLVFLSFGIHLMPLLLIPGTLAFVIMTDKKIFLNPKLLLFTFALIIIGITTYYYLMVRAAANPAINEVNPDNFKALWKVISRAQYGPMKIYPRKTQMQTHLNPFMGIFEQIKIFFKYFSWQYFPFPRESTNNFLKYISVIGTYIYVFTGFWGMFIHYKKDRKTFWLFFILYLLLSLGLVIYLNLKFSPSDPNPINQDREVRERDYFWAPAFFIFMFYVSIGLYWIYIKLKGINIFYGRGILAVSFLMGLTPLISNIHSHVNRRGNWIAHDYGHNLLITPKENSILFTYGDNDTFPVWFLQQVKGFRKFDATNKKGVRLSNFSLMNTSWYIRQLKESGIPIDFASPFRGTNLESKYNRIKRSGKTNLNFEQWVIKNIRPLRSLDGKWLRVSDILVRDIILCATGKTPTLKDFIMPADAFVKKYIKKDFNPSINIYFSYPVESYTKKVFGKHLKLEGFAYRLVGEKGNNMINSAKVLDKLTKEFKTSYCDNPTIYTGRAQGRVLSNHASIYITSGIQLFSKFEKKIKKPISESDQDTLKIFEYIFKKAFTYAINSPSARSITPQVAKNLERIYTLLNEEKTSINFSDSLLDNINVPSVHLLRGELLILNVKNENSYEYNEAKKEFNYLLKKAKFKHSGYAGLIQLYNIAGKYEKIKEIFLEMSNEPELFEKILYYTVNFKPKTAIILLENWKNIYPGDTKRINKLILEIKRKNKEELY